ncbi:hypothetical protein POM88_014121 [Heracleum sosnowskyi]|uniref:Uncharacterized protein n=1 Tax=Heracleum sosnowskyi TaxID=360622 RepID=A0AAD8J3I0_9APIA|nr:hypothetical protein POM88_014121 [Heracleum sosnowskyi]
MLLTSREVFPGCNLLVHVIGQELLLYAMSQPLLLDMLGASSLVSVGMNSSSNFDLQKQGNELRDIRSWTLPSFLAKSLNILRESSNLGSEKSKVSSLLTAHTGQYMFPSKLKEVPRGYCWNKSQLPKQPPGWKYWFKVTSTGKITCSSYPAVACCIFRTPSWGA